MLPKHETPMEPLNRYDRATVALWTKSYVELMQWTDQNHLIEAATHALLAGLRSSTFQRALLVRYESDAPADFALIGSLLPDGPSDELLWRVRDSAFYLRWHELTAESG